MENHFTVKKKFLSGVDLNIFFTLYIGH